MNVTTRIYNERFAPGAEPRSEAYRHGVLDRLRHDAENAPSPISKPRYQPGTAERDAWLSGLDAGHMLWLRHLDRQQESAYLMQPDIPRFLREQAS